MTESLSRLIETNKNNFASHRFFSYIKNSEIPLGQRLSFLPCMSHFIMSFSDINKYVLPYPSPKNSLESMVNTHAKEDANHWPWFIHDLQQLRMNPRASLTEILQYLWSEDLSSSRRLTYELITLVAGKEAKFKLVAIEVMEATGNVMFKTLSEITAQSKLDLKFCGSLHASHESGHALSSNEEIIDRLIFTKSEQQHVTDLIHNGFNAFHRFIDQLLEHVEKSTRFKLPH